MIQFKTITKDNYIDVFKLTVGEGQEKFVASNIVSLAQAWVFYDTARPYAIYNDDVLVGFMMLNHDQEKKSSDIWRFMIGGKYQRQGFGKAALEYAINLIKNEVKTTETIFLSFVPGNDFAQKLYESVGFKLTGEVEGNEIVMALKL